MRWIKFVTPLLFCSTVAATPVKTTHQHGSRSHSHVLPNTKLKHQHNRGAIGASITPQTHPSKVITPTKNSNNLVLRNFINTTKNKKHGYYSSDEVKVLWLNKGRKVKLLETLTFTDPCGKKWVAPKGHIVDGASIPEPFQPLIGTPYGGRYVLASVIHDVACDEKKESWKAVHEVFYNAMLTSGVPIDKADLMYAAVYEGGPRWGADAEKRLSDQDYSALISSSEFNPLISHFTKMYGELKSYSGTTIYTGARDGNLVVGVTKKYNGTYINAEFGNETPTLSAGWRRPAEWGGRESTDRALKKLSKGRLAQRTK